MSNSFIKNASDLVTTHEQIRSGFLHIALEKNKVGDPYVKEALTFKAMVQHTKSPDEFLNMENIRPFILTASGLSDKARKYLDKNEQNRAIQDLIENFLKPAGEKYIDEVIYRYLVIKGDAVGGIMRNRIGALGQEKLIRAIISCMNIRGISYWWMSKHQLWTKSNNYNLDIEKDIKAMHWVNGNKSRILIFNCKIKTVNKNVDICLFDGSIQDYAQGITQLAEKAIMLGELKGGIDPAGADEHWKTANTALERIRTSFKTVNHPVLTSFVGAAIVNDMAEEIYAQLQDGRMANAANLTDINQLTAYCNWILDI